MHACILKKSIISLGCGPLFHKSEFDVTIMVVLALLFLLDNESISRIDISSVAFASILPRFSPSSSCQFNEIINKTGKLCGGTGMPVGALSLLLVFVGVEMPGG